MLFFAFAAGRRCTGHMAGSRWGSKGPSARPSPRRP